MPCTPPLLRSNDFNFRFLLSALSHPYHRCANIHDRFTMRAQKLLLLYNTYVTVRISYIHGTIAKAIYRPKGLHLLPFRFWSRRNRFARQTAKRSVTSRLRVPVWTRATELQLAIALSISRFLKFKRAHPVLGSFFPTRNLHLLKKRNKKDRIYHIAKYLGR